MAEREDNKDPIGSRLVTVASLLTDLIGKDAMVRPDAGSPQGEALGIAPAPRPGDDARREDPPCR